MEVKKKLFTKDLDLYKKFSMLKNNNNADVAF